MSKKIKLILFTLGCIVSTFLITKNCTNTPQGGSSLIKKEQRIKIQKIHDSIKIHEIKVETLWKSRKEIISKEQTQKEIIDTIPEDSVMSFIKQYIEYYEKSSE